MLLYFLIFELCVTMHSLAYTDAIHFENVKSKAIGKQLKTNLGNGPKGGNLLKSLELFVINFHLDANQFNKTKNTEFSKIIITRRRGPVQIEDRYSNSGLGSWSFGIIIFLV